MEGAFIPNAEQSQPKFTARSRRAAHLEAGGGNSGAFLTSELGVKLQETLELLCPAALPSNGCNHPPVSSHPFLPFLFISQIHIFKKKKTSLQDLTDDILLEKFCKWLL